MWVQSLGREDPLEQEMATPSSILAWRIPGTEEPDTHSPWGHKELDMPEHSRAHRSLHAVLRSGRTSLYFY